MPSFKLWFVSAVLFAIVFPRSTVVAEEVPADEGIVGSWRFTFVFDPKTKWKAAFAAQQKDWEVWEELYGVHPSVEIRADGTMAFLLGRIELQQATWKLVDKGEKKLELEFTFEGNKYAYSFASTSKDQFTVEVPDLREDGLLTEVRFHRKKDAPKP